VKNTDTDTRHLGDAGKTCVNYDKVIPFYTQSERTMTTAATRPVASKIDQNVRGYIKNWLMRVSEPRTG
jgi:hypothetical protein